MAGVGKTIAESILVFYGCVLLSVAWGYSLLQRETWLGPRESERKKTIEFSRRLWSLDESEDPTVAHDFLQLASGLQLHYLASRSRLRKPPQNLVIFLHGFPDSCHLFRHVLDSDLAKDAQLVSLDLPGCGGSDSLDVYSADLVLNAVVEAIVLIRRRFEFQTGRRCILVGHDWGGVVGYRIAAGTRGLFDVMVTMNSVSATCVEAEIRRRFSAGMSELGPVFNQLRKSNYTFLLQLKFSWPRAFPNVTAALLRYVHRSGTHRNLAHVEEDALVSSLVASYGPSEAECLSHSAANGPAYGPSVLARARTSPPGDWNSRFKLYREGLILDPWTLAEAHSAHSIAAPSPSAISSSNSEDGEKRRSLLVPAQERFKYPVIVLFGVEDEALDHRIVVDPLVDFFMRPEDGSAYRPSRIRKMNGCGHWSPMTEIGTATLIEELHGLLE